MKEVESDPESASGTGAPPKVNQFRRLVGPLITPGFKMKSVDYLSNPASRMRQNDRITYRTDHINSLAKVIKD